jgi:hypothetical protein
VSGSLWNTPVDPHALDHLGPSLRKVKVSKKELLAAIEKGKREAERLGFCTKPDWGKLMNQWLP